MKSRSDTVKEWLERQFWVQKSLLKQEQESVLRLEGAVNMLSYLLTDLEREKTLPKKKEA
jgi:hypothetical protein